MITEKEIKPWLDCVGVPEECKRLLEQLLKERDAYRKMAAGKYTTRRSVSREEFKKELGIEPVRGYLQLFITDTDWEAIDAEAQRILEAKKGG